MKKKWQPGCTSILSAACAEHMRRLNKRFVIVVMPACLRIYSENLTMDESARIEELCRKFEEDRRRYERQRLHYEATQAMIQSAIDLYIAQLSAPWQALAWYIRATDSAGERDGA